VAAAAAVTAAPVAVDGGTTLPVGPTRSPLTTTMTTTTKTTTMAVARAAGVTTNCTPLPLNTGAIKNE